MSDVKAAAERLRNSQTVDGAYLAYGAERVRGVWVMARGELQARMAADRVTLAEAYLAEHPADDDQERQKIFRMALEEIREIWAGAECGEALYAQEAYAIRLCREMYSVAVAALGIEL